MLQYTLIYILWISVFAIFLYKQYQSNTIILLYALLISIFIYYNHNYKLPSKNIQSTHFVEWLDSLIQAKDSDEKHRCYYQIKDMLLNDSLLKHEHHNDHKILDIIDKYKPTQPVPHNMQELSVGFTEKT